MKNWTYWLLWNPLATYLFSSNKYNPRIKSLLIKNYYLITILLTLGKYSIYKYHTVNFASITTPSLFLSKISNIFKEEKTTSKNSMFSNLLHGFRSIRLQNDISNISFMRFLTGWYMFWVISVPYIFKNIH